MAEIEKKSNDFNNKNFTHLHTHTCMSILDSVCKINDLVDKAKEMGMKSLAITDHGVMIGVIQFYNACKKAGIKPIIGCELYVAPTSRFNKSKDIDEDKYHHLILLAKNEVGYTNLCKLSSYGYTEGFYSKPRVDKELLRKYSDGLICMSACLSGEIPKTLANFENGYEKAKEVVAEYIDIYGKDNYFLEVQDHNIPLQKKINKLIFNLGEELNIPVVATNDVHYINQEDYIIQDIVKCIANKKTMDDPTRWKFDTQEFYFKSKEQMLDIFPNHPEAIYNTQKIVDMCNFDFDFGKVHLPDYKIPDGFDNNFEYLKNLSYTGFEKKYKNITKEQRESYLERLDYELGVINDMGFVNYFLIVWDYVNFARKSGIYVGPGRGSGAGSIVAFSIGITLIEPMKYNLIFERFLNPERISMPDFDIDFEPERRWEIFKYITDTYNKYYDENEIDCSAKVLAIQTMASRGAIRDVAKVFGIEYKIAQEWAKLVPEDPKMNIKKALNTSPTFKELYDTNKEAHNIINYAIKVEGLPRQTSSHAAGIVIADKSITNYAPIMTAVNKETKERENVVQFVKDELEPLGLIKMDILGLRNLSLIGNACKNISKEIGKEFRIEDIDIDDKAVYDMIGSGNTVGVFQLESEGMRKTVMDLKPESLEDIIAIIALYRPGPMDNIPKYIENKKHPNQIEYLDERLKPILDVTYGIIVYQEQVMQILVDFAGFSTGRADIARKAMSKKKQELIDAELNIFKYGSEELGIDGCLKRGFEEYVIDALISDIKAFAEYAFNKAHSAAYGLIAYQTAYMMKYYKIEYMAEILSSFITSRDDLSHYMTICKNTFNIPVKLPDINESNQKFTSLGDSILFGIEGINGVGGVLANQIISEREKNGKFKSFYDFLIRCKVGDSEIKSLAKCGAFNNLGININTILKNIDYIQEFNKNIAPLNNQGYRNIFSTNFDHFERIFLPEIKEYPELDGSTLSSYELETLNIFVSSNPLSFYTRALSLVNVTYYKNIAESFEKNDGEYNTGDYIAMPIVILEVDEKKKVVFLTVSNNDSIYQITVFKDTFDQNKYLLIKGNILLSLCQINTRFSDLGFIGHKFIFIPNNTDDKDSFEKFEEDLTTIKVRKKVVKKKSQTVNNIIPTFENNNCANGLYINCKNRNTAYEMMEKFQKSYGTNYVYFYLRDENKVLFNKEIKFGLSNINLYNYLIETYMLSEDDIKFILNK